jgi:hypothetical protein
MTYNNQGWLPLTALPGWSLLEILNFQCHVLTEFLNSFHIRYISFNFPLTELQTSWRVFLRNRGASRRAGTLNVPIFRIWKLGHLFKFVFPHFPTLSFFFLVCRMEIFFLSSQKDVILITDHDYPHWNDRKVDAMTKNNFQFWESKYFQELFFS